MRASALLAVVLGSCLLVLGCNGKDESRSSEAPAGKPGAGEEGQSSGAPAAKPPAGEKAQGSAAPAGKPPAGQQAGSRVRAGFQVFAHPLGFRFQHPKDWTAKETAWGIQLTPPDALPTTAAVGEFYLFTATAAGDIKKADDPRIAQHLNATVMRLAPFLQRAAQPQQMPGPAAGAVYTWTGRHPTGPEVKGKVYTSIRQGYVLGLFAAAESSRLAGRKATLEQVFATSKVGAPQVDQRMVGRWYHNTYRSTGSYSSRTHLSSTRVLVLVADGTIHAARQTALMGLQRRPGRAEHDDWSALGQSMPDHGRWGSANGRIYMMWSDGVTAGFSLHVQGAPPRREALLTSPTGQKQLWTEYNE